MTIIAIPPTPVDLEDFDYTTLPPLLQGFDGTAPGIALGQLRGLIEHAITHHPRTLQVEIGPSEIGTPCDHCLAAKLAGWPQHDRTIPWLPTVGTAVHAWLEDAVRRHEADRNATHTTGRRYLMEHRVTVGQILGRDITGSCDLFDIPPGLVTDFKIVGPTTLKKCKAGPSRQYRAQVHLYGRGVVAAGHRVEHVAIAFLPRNAATLDAAVWWSEPYDEQVALDALARANRIAVNITALADISTDAVAGYIAGLARDPDCFDCARYPDAPATTSPLTDLIG